jgi:sugar/nucleoside kinase (ribokinase family)
VYFAPQGFNRLADLRRPHTVVGANSGPLRTELIPAERVEQPLDPTGCGDVWGATYFSRLLAGDMLGDAIRAAHRAAARNVEHRGATGLADHLRGKLSFT